MVDIMPSHESVKERIDALEAKLRRVTALVSAASDVASTLTGTSPELVIVQSLLEMLEETSPTAMSDVEWLLNSLAIRSRQIDSLLLKSVA